MVSAARRIFRQTRERNDYAERVGPGTPTENHPNVRHGYCMSPQVARSGLAGRVRAERPCINAHRGLLANSTSRRFTSAWARQRLWHREGGSRWPDEPRGCPVGEKSHPWQVGGWAVLGDPSILTFSLKTPCHSTRHTFENSGARLSAARPGAALVAAAIASSLSCRHRQDRAHGNNGKFFGLPLW